MLRISFLLAAFTLCAQAEDQIPIDYSAEVTVRPQPILSTNQAAIPHSISQKPASLNPSELVPEDEKLLRRSIQDLSHSLIGLPYVWDTNGEELIQGKPSFDCSGFLHYVMKKSLGVEAFPLKYKLSELPLNSNDGSPYKNQSTYYKDVLEKSGARIPNCLQARVGDIVFFPAASNRINHIGVITQAYPSLHFTTAQSKSIGVREDYMGSLGGWWNAKPLCFRNIWLDKKLSLQRAAQDTTPSIEIRRAIPLSPFETH